MQVQGLRRESERVARLQEEMRTCTFTPRLNKKTLHVRHDSPPHHNETQSFAQDQPSHCSYFQTGGLHFDLTCPLLLLVSGHS